jgi:ankyrin repeat protein
MDYKENMRTELERKWKYLFRFGKDDVSEDEDEEQRFIWLCNEILHYASEVGDIEKIIILIDQIQSEFDIEIDADMVDESGQTPLLLASGNGYPDIVEFLLQNGADANSASSGDTPLITVAQNYIMDKDDQLSIVEKLISAGANVNFQDKYGKTSLILATESVSPKIVSKLLLSGADISIKDKCGNTAMDIAADSIEHAEIEQIIKEYY